MDYPERQGEVEYPSSFFDLDRPPQVGERESLIERQKLHNRIFECLDHSAYFDQLHESIGGYND